MESPSDKRARGLLQELAARSGLNALGGKTRRTSSRFCLGVEHGDYNGAELFGVGTDRFLWMAYRANDSGRVHLFSGAFPSEGIVEFSAGEVPPPRSSPLWNAWARFPLGVDYVLRREGFRCEKGLDAVVHSDIPGGGMSRSASLTLNLVFAFLEVNGHAAPEPMKIAEMAQAVENDYIGSPCGILDQVMILFAKKNQGTLFDPSSRSVRHVPLGSGAPDFCLIGMDTGTERPGLEKSTYRLRRAECEELVELARPEFGLTCLADVKDRGLFERIEARFGALRPELVDRLRYLFEAQLRFKEMLEAWRQGDAVRVGRLFREDGLGLRDLYRISGPELECMCDIARTVPECLGERMLGGGDKGAAGALVLKPGVDALRAAVDRAFPRSYPALADRYAVHELNLVDGVVLL